MKYANKFSNYCNCLVIGGGNIFKNISSKIFLTVYWPFIGLELCRPSQEIDLGVIMLHRNGYISYSSK